MKKQIAVIVLVLAAWLAAGFIWGMSVGKADGAKQMARHILNPIFEDEFQTSEYEWLGFLDSTFIQFVCDEQGIGIDVNEGDWRIECPKCESGVAPEFGDGEESTGGAFVEKTLDTWTVCRFRTNWIHVADKLSPGESVNVTFEGSRLYCANCLYPLGIDWKIIDLNPDPNNADITITNGTRDRVTITYLDANDTWVTTDCNSADPNG